MFQYFKIGCRLICFQQSDENSIVRTVKEIKNCIKIEWKVGQCEHVTIRLASFFNIITHYFLFKNLIFIVTLSSSSLIFLVPCYKAQSINYLNIHGFLPYKGLYTIICINNLFGIFVTSNL
jgi:hypothetical protein